MKSSEKKIALALVLMVAFVDWMGVGLVYPMFSSMIFDRTYDLVPTNATDTVRGGYLGILLAALSLTQFLGSPILGTLSDVKGRKKILIYSLFIGVFGYLLALIAVMHPNLWLLIFSRLIIGISTGSAAIVGAAIADLSTSDKEKTKNFALYSTAIGIGFAVGPFLGGKLCVKGCEPFSGFAFPFLIAGLVLLINTLLVIFFFKETHFIRKSKPVSWILAFYNLRRGFRLPKFRFLFMTIFIFAFGWSFFYEFIPVTWIKRYALNVGEVSLVFAYASAIYAISSILLIRPIVNRYHPAPTLFYALAAQGVYTLLFLIPISYLGIWVYIPLQQFLAALIFPTLQSMISQRSSPDIQGEILGIMQSVLAFGFLLSPLISGPLLGLTTEMPIIIGGICFLIAATVLGISLKKEIFQKHISS